MARLTEYDERQAANRLRVPITAYRWAVHAGIVPPPDAGPRTWTRAAVDAMDGDAIASSLPGGPISRWQAAQQIAEALGTPNQPGQPAAVRVFTVRRLVELGMLTDLSSHREDVLLHRQQLAEVCARPGLAELVAAEAPLGPDQAADRLAVRRADFDHMVRLSWAKPAEWQEVKFGRSTGTARQQVEPPSGVLRRGSRNRAAYVDQDLVRHPVLGPIQRDGPVGQQRVLSAEAPHHVHSSGGMHRQAQVCGARVGPRGIEHDPRASGAPGMFRRIEAPPNDALDIGKTVCGLGSPQD